MELEGEKVRNKMTNASIRKEVGCSDMMDVGGDDPSIRREQDCIYELVQLVDARDGQRVIKQSSASGDPRTTDKGACDESGLIVDWKWMMIFCGTRWSLQREMFQDSLLHFYG